MRHALLGACLALPLLATGTALAAEPAPRTITVPPGAVVLILPSADTTTVTQPFAGMTGPRIADPMLQLIALQDAMIRTAMAQMDAPFAQPMFPPMNRMIEAALNGAPMPGQGVTTVFTSVTDGPGVCSEHVVYEYKANGGKPLVTLTRSGNACAPIGTTAPTEAAQPLSPPPAAAPAHGPRLWTVSDPPRPIETGTPRS